MGRGSATYAVAGCCWLHVGLGWMYCTNPFHSTGSSGRTLAPALYVYAAAIDPSNSHSRAEAHPLLARRESSARAKPTMSS